MGTILKYVKDKMIKIIKAQPDDTSLEEIMRELAFEFMIEKGLNDSEKDRTLSNEEMKKRIVTWQK